MSRTSWAIVVLLVVAGIGAVLYESTNRPPRMAMETEALEYAKIISDPAATFVFTSNDREYVNLDFDTLAQGPGREVVVWCFETRTNTWIPIDRWEPVGGGDLFARYISLRGLITPGQPYYEFTVRLTGPLGIIYADGTHSFCAQE